jgi:hypothetical protein
LDGDERHGRCGCGEQTLPGGTSLSFRVGGIILTRKIQIYSARNSMGFAYTTHKVEMSNCSMKLPLVFFH